MTICERLKNETMDLHMEAERHPLQASMIKGEITREGYAAYLGQVFLVQKALEREVRKAIVREARLAATAREELCIEGLQRQDLAFFGVDPESVRALGATERAIAGVEGTAKDDPIALLGRHYVTEGSKNGSAFIARALRRSLGLPASEGLRSLEAHGADQRAVWGAWKERVAALLISEAEGDRIVGAAKEMFGDIIGISEAVWSEGEAKGPTVVVRAKPGTSRV
jgi:heme oxygenase